MAAEQALIECPGCSRHSWPVQEMDERGGFFTKCPRPECGTRFPAEKPPAQEQETVVVPLPKVTPPASPAPAPIPAASSDSLGSAELQYLRTVIAECERLTDVQQIKQRLRRLSALVQ